MVDKGTYDFYLNVQIKDSLDNVLIEDLDTTQVVVYDPASQDL